jgi:transcriptional regulator with XRE-family HTH domain
MSTLADVADQLKSARLAAGLTQAELARRASVSRTTVARMETVAKGDMSVSVLVRLLEAAGYELKAVKLGMPVPSRMCWLSSDPARQRHDPRRAPRTEGRGDAVSRA